MEDSNKDDVRLAFSFSDEDFMAFLPETEEGQFTTRWSDFNYHDPGVTAYEAMQLSFEDFFYRYDFPIQDLMQGVDSSAFDDWGVTDLYTTYAVIEDDYRRVLATSKHIENIAVKPVLKANLNPDTEDLICLLDVNVATDLKLGHYDVVTGWEEALIENRAVGEYFNRQKNNETFIRDKKCKVNIKTEVTLYPIGEDTLYYRKIYEALEAYLLPNLESADYRMINKRGTDFTKLFTGPAPNNNHQKNVIKESLFHQPAYRKFIIVSELFEVLEKLDFVRTVNFVQIELEGGRYESSILDLGDYTFTELNKLHINDKELEQCIPLAELYVPLEDEPPNFLSELLIDGQYRDLSSSSSLQVSFPPNYTMGKYVRDQSDKELDKTSSFRAFLYLMDQVRANISGQMGKFYEIFSITKKMPDYVEEDISDKPVYKNIDIPDLSKQKEHDKRIPKKNLSKYSYMWDSEEVQNQFTEQRLNYLLALNGWGVGANASTFWNRNEYTKIKNDFLNLVHGYSERPLRINTEFNHCFQSNSLVLLQEKLRVILQYDVLGVRILEHLFLQPVWTSERGLNFELTVFLFEKKNPKHIKKNSTNIKKETRDYKNYIERMIRAMVPVHVVETVKWIPLEDRNPSKTLYHFDEALKAAVPPEEIFYLNGTISPNQRSAMVFLKNDWVQQ